MDRKKNYQENSKPDKSEKTTLESPLDCKEIKPPTYVGSQKKQ